MERKCICGASIEVNSRLCSECKAVYGKFSSEWPVWLQEWMQNYNSELYQENAHRNYALDERLMADEAYANLQSQSECNPGFDDDVVELDTWGNLIEHVDGFTYVDPDRVIACEKRFDRRLKAIHSGYSKPSMPKGEKLEKLRKARLETHLYEDRNKY